MGLFLLRHAITSILTNNSTVIFLVCHQDLIRFQIKFFWANLGYQIVWLISTVTSSILATIYLLMLRKSGMRLEVMHIPWIFAINLYIISRIFNNLTSIFCTINRNVNHQFNYTKLRYTQHDLLGIQNYSSFSFFKLFLVERKPGAARKH